MGAVKTIQNIITKANNVTNDVMKVVDPIGGRLKEVTETKSQAKANSLLGGLFGGPPKPGESYEDLGGTTAQAPATAALSEDSLVQDKAKKFNAAKQRRQGFSGGSTLITSTEDEDQKMNKNTLLGM